MTLAAVRKRNKIEFVRINELKKCSELSMGFVNMSTQIFFHNRQNCQTIESLYIYIDRRTATDMDSFFACTDKFKGDTLAKKYYMYIVRVPPGCIPYVLCPATLNPIRWLGGIMITCTKITVQDNCTNMQDNHTTVQH